MNRQTEKDSAIAEDSPRPRVSASPCPDASPSPRRFSVHVAWTLLARAVMIVNSVAAGIIVARLLGAEGVGALTVINVAVLTIVQLSGAGLPSANTYFITQDKRHLAPVAINSLVFAFAVGSLLAVGLAGLSVWRPDWFGMIPPGLIGVAAISIPFQLVSLLGLNIFLATGRVGRFNFLDLAGQSAVLINAVLALVILQAQLRTLVFLNTAASILVGVIIIWLIGRYVAADRQSEQPARPDLNLFKRMMRYGVKSHVATLAAMLIFRADIIIVNHFRGTGEAGVYSVAAQVAMMLFILPSVIATLLFPRVASRQDKHGELTCIATRHTAFVMLLVCLAAAPASYLLPLLYGAEFAEATVLLLMLLPGVYLVSIESVLVQHFNAAGLPWAIPLFWVATLAFNLVLTFALVPVFGARGAAAASTLSYAMIFTLVAFHFRARTGQRLLNALLLSRAEMREMFAAGRVGALLR